MSYNHKIGIIGGGPAGSSLAIYLSKKNFDVCIFEKSLFPRETVCGEFLSHEVTSVLKDLNLYEKFLLLKPNKISKFRLFNNGKSLTESDFEFDAFSMKRSIFDNFLLSEAKAMEVRVYQPAAIADVRKSKNGFELYSEDGSHFFVEKLIVASGKNSLLDRKLGRNYSEKKTGFNGLKFHVNISNDAFPSDEIHIYIDNGVYCGVSSPQNGQLTFCYLENKFSNRKNPYEKLSGIFNRKDDNGLIYRFEKDGFSRIKKYGTGNIYFGRKELVYNDIFFIGDSARVIAPLAGDGIGMALETSELLSNLLNESEQKRWSIEQLKNSYLTSWNRKFNYRLKLAKSIQNLIFDRRFNDLNLQSIIRFPFMVKYLMRKTRSSGQYTYI